MPFKDLSCSFELLKFYYCFYDKAFKILLDIHHARNPVSNGCQRDWKDDIHSNPTPEVAILRNSLPKSRYGIYATLVVEVSVVVFLIVVVFVDIYIRDPGSLSTMDHALYITGTTIVASAISALGTGHIRLYWLARILPAFKHADRSDVEINIARGRTVLGLGTWQQQIHHRFVAFP